MVSKCVNNVVLPACGALVAHQSVSINFAVPIEQPVTDGHPVQLLSCPEQCLLCA